MNALKNKIKGPLFVFFLVFCYYGLIYQVKGNYKYFEKKKTRVEKAYTEAISHPLLIVNPSKLEPYVKAYYLIKGSESSRLWLVCPELDPAVMLNYQVYPKKLIMSVETQNALNWKNLTRGKDCVHHVLPESYEKVVRIEDSSAELLDQWDGNQ